MINAYDLNFTRNSIQHKVLHILREENLSSAQISTQIKGRKDIVGMRTILAELSKRNLVRSVGFDQWALTHDGMDACLALGGKPLEANRLSIRGKQSDVFARPNYDGRELEDTCHRPGAYDYRNHPSLFAQTSVWYDRGFTIMRQSPAQDPR
jgi:hypothetical protein